MKAHLVESREIAPNTRHFVFESPEWNAAFVPGQFVSITASVGDDEITRAYSIVSPPNGGRFALCANLVENGHLSPVLFGLKRGDEIQFKGPYGAFILRRPVSDSIFVATGTGIAPFRSMLLSQLGPHADRRFTLIFGVRHEHGLLYDDELRALAQEHANFDYRPTLTRPPEHWAGRVGRIQQYVFETLGERRDIDVYICGLREMVDDVRANLKQIGLDRKRIIYEKYD
ncbi:MAG TPA: FAD-binding oxidoreductase [Bryobacteraceae bacterium]|jgi:CDP-4-dehydro-6-deoxyglucose reductase|nr:FAD-binding oxidoreductase [Bryobacteraceae bacterium]